MTNECLEPCILAKQNIAFEIIRMIAAPARRRPRDEMGTYEEMAFLCRAARGHLDFSDLPTCCSASKSLARYAHLAVV